MAGGDERTDVPVGRVIVRDFDRWATVHWLTPSTGEHEEAADPADVDPCGWLVERAGTTMALYRDLERLWFAVDGATHDVTHAECEVSADGPRRTVTLLRGGGPVVATTFEDRRVAEFAVLEPYDFTAADPEDFDWALFLRNVFADPARRDRVGRPIN